MYMYYNGVHLLFSPLSGDRCIVNCRILNNKRQVLTTDNKGDVTLWDVLHVSIIHQCF